MEKSKIESLQKLQKMEQFYLLINAGTHNPFVVCDKENFNDQVWIFEVEDDMKEAAKPYMIEQKHKLIPAKIENKGYLPFFTSLFTLGVNAVVFVEKEQTTEFELTEIVKRPILEKIPEDKRPLENPALQITGTYFMQELRREVPMEEKENIKELEEEMAANLVKSKFMIAVEKPKEGKTEEEQKKEADRIYKEIVDDAHREAESIINRANIEIQREEEKVKYELKQQVVDISVMLSEKALGESIDESKHRELINDFIEKVGI